MSASVSLKDREEKLTLDRILGGSNKKIRELYKRHKLIFASKDIDEISRIAHLHVLKLELGSNYDKFLIKHLPNSIREELGKGIDNSILYLLEHPDSIPTFERYVVDKITGKSVKGEGDLIEVTSVISRKNIAKTFLTKFEKKKAFRNAVNGYRTIVELKKIVEENYSDFTNPDYQYVKNLFKRLRPVDIRFADPKKKLLGVTFVNAQDFQDELRQKHLGIEQKLEYLKEISDLHLAVWLLGAKYEEEIEQRKLGEDKFKFLRKLKQKLFKQGVRKRSHVDGFIRKFYPRIDPNEEVSDLKSMNKYVKDVLGRPIMVTLDIRMQKYQLHHWDLVRFHHFMMMKVLPSPELYNKYYTQGDALPSNHMVMHDKELNNTSDRVYSLVDFEFFCKDAIQNAFVQLWSKSGILDYKGDSLRTRDGKDAEQELLNHEVETLKNITRIISPKTRFEKEDEEYFVEVYNRFKITNYLFWAANYKWQAREGRKNRTDSELNDRLERLSKYFYTLSVREMKKQGLKTEEKVMTWDGEKIEDDLDYTNKTFGMPLSDEELKIVHAELNPHERIVSFYKDQRPINVDKKLDELVETFKKSKKIKMIRIGAYATAGLTLLTIMGGMALNFFQKRAAENYLRNIYTNPQVKISPFDVKPYSFLNPQEENPPELEALIEKYSHTDAFIIYILNNMNLPGEGMLKNAKKINKENYLAYLPSIIFHKYHEGLWGGDFVGRDMYKREMAEIDKERESSTFGQFIKLKELEKYYDELRLCDSAETIVETRINDEYKKLARQYEQGKFTQKDFVTDVYINDFCKNRIDPVLVKTIMGRINRYHNPYVNTESFRDISTFINVRNDKTKKGEVLTPREFFNLSVGDLIRIFRQYGVDPLNPCKNQEKLKNALGFYLTHEMQMDDIKKFSEKYGATLFDSLPSITQGMVYEFMRKYCPDTN